MLIFVALSVENIDSRQKIEKYCIKGFKNQTRSESYFSAITRSFIQEKLNTRDLINKIFNNELFESCDRRFSLIGKIDSPNSLSNTTTNSDLLHLSISLSPFILRERVLPCIQNTYVKWRISVSEWIAWFPVRFSRVTKDKSDGAIINTSRSLRLNKRRVETSPCDTDK